jgi:hypothetical protein
VALPAGACRYFFSGAGCKRHEEGKCKFNHVLPNLPASTSLTCSAQIALFVKEIRLWDNLDAIAQVAADRYGATAKVDLAKEKIFISGPPSAITATAQLLKQTTSPIKLVIGESQLLERSLYQELEETGQLRKWCRELGLRHVYDTGNFGQLFITLMGPGLKQGQLLARIGQYHDSFEPRHTLRPVGESLAQLLRKGKIGDTKLTSLAEKYGEGFRMRFSERQQCLEAVVRPGVDASQLALLEAELEELLQELGGTQEEGLEDAARFLCQLCRSPKNKITLSLSICGHTVGVYFICMSAAL